MSTRPLARYIALRSYFPWHTVLSVEKDADGDCKMILHEGEKGDRLTSEVAIPGEFADLIGTLFRTAIGQARKPVEPREGLDGTSYYFTATGPDGKLITGTILSPDSGTPTDRLVRICKELSRLTIEEDTDFHKITLIIQEFISDLNRPGQNRK